MATLKQSTVYNRMFLMVLASDHISPATGLTPVVTISKAGAAFGAAAGAVTEVANGFYKVAYTTADTGTLGDLAFHAAVATADNTDFVDQVTANILGDTLPANVTQWNGTNVTTPDTAGSPKVTITAGTAAGQLDFTSGVVKANTVQVLGGACPAVNVTGVPKVDVVDWLGSAPNVLVSGRVDASVGALANNVITAASINAAALNGKGDWLLAVNYVTPPSAASIATTVWQDTTASSDFSTAGSIGLLLKTDVDATISSRGTGTALTASQVENAVLDGLTANHGVAGSFGLLIKTDLDATVSSRSTYAGADTAGTTTLLARIPSTLTITAGKVDVNDKTGFSLVSTGLDLVLVAGKTLPVAIKLIGATTAGKLPSGAGSGQENFQDFSGAAAVDVTVDSSGNRTAIVYH